MSPRIDEKINVLTPAAEEPISNYEVVMGKIDYDAHKSYKRIDDIALRNENVKKQHKDKEKP